MNVTLDQGTALLAAVVGASLLTATASATQSGTPVDARQAREIAVLARVLENRLGAVRQSMHAVGANRRLWRNQ
jgi:hypothetical protein